MNDSDDQRSRVTELLQAIESWKLVASEAYYSAEAKMTPDVRELFSCTHRLSKLSLSCGIQPPDAIARVQVALESWRPGGNVKRLFAVVDAAMAAVGAMEEFGVEEARRLGVAPTPECWAMIRSTITRRLLGALGDMKPHSLNELLAIVWDGKSIEPASQATAIKRAKKKILKDGFDIETVDDRVQLIRLSPPADK